jgi:hypothetical protein
MDSNGLLTHVTKLEHVFAYEAPRALPRPRTIRPDEELVEVVTDGKVDFAVGDKLLTFGRGSMFWHQAGQQTIHLNHIEEPYRCLSLVFRVTGQPVWNPPRVCRWHDVDGVLAFGRLMLDVASDRPFSREFHGHHAYSRLLLEAQRAVRHELLSQPWPAPLARFAWHMLVLEHELIPLTRHAARLGYHVDGWGGQGGWIPYYGGAIKPTKLSYVTKGLPPILERWKEVKF